MFFKLQEEKLYRKKYTSFNKINLLTKFMNEISCRFCCEKNIHLITSKNYQIIDTSIV